MSLYNEYEAYVQQAIADYGKDIVVLYRCGGFYEIYSIDDGLVDMKKICELLNIQMSRRNKAILEVNRSNTWMAGFPMYALQKFINILVDENFTVVVVDQVTDPPKPKRAITSVISPGTDIQNIHTVDANNLMALYFEENIDFKTKKPLLSMGIAIIDISTGKSKVYEASSNSADAYLALDEAYRLIQVENPREIIFLGCHVPGVISYLEVGNRCIHEKWSSFDPEILKLAYQKQLLQKVFPKHGLLSVIEYLDLERHPTALISFVYLLQFSYRHNDTILQKIHKPDIVEADKHLVLSFNCVKHLNIVSADSRVNNLLSLLNKTQTSIGRRYFREQFMNPIIDTTELENRYDIVDKLMHDSDDGLLDDIQKLLSRVYDVERLARRIHLNLLNPCELVQLNASLQAMLDIKQVMPTPLYTRLCQSDVRPHVTLSALNQLLEDHIDWDEVAKYNLDNISRSFFKKGRFIDVDNEQKELDKNISYFTELVSKVNAFVEFEFFKLDCNQVDGYHLVITSKRYSDCKKKLESFLYKDEYIFRNVSTKASTNALKVLHPQFYKINEAITYSQNELCARIKSCFAEFLTVLSNTHKETMDNLVSSIACIDFYSTVAKVSRQYRYCKPIITDRYDGRSFIEAHDLRHPIIERLCTDTEYVPNDVILGTPDVNGILLYGTNMVGKSAYMKSIGIATIMAQCGMYVPASDFAYFPYTKIFTRIPSGDDLFKGCSTFAVEISELRSILKRADANSLVIGDELASGTESISAISIVGAGISSLYERGSSFIFATHLHDLTSLEKIKGMQRLKVYHLSVLYDEQTRKLVFNRKLQLGQGHTLYGLEVCRALDLGSDFLRTANELRHELLDMHEDLLPTKTSRYNKKLYVDACAVCGEKASEVHHVKHQASADSDGFVGSVHKNTKTNLVNLCEQCHDKVHKQVLRINGYIQTTNGIELDLEHTLEIDTMDVCKKRIQELRDSKSSVSKIRKTLQSEGHEISEYKIRKLLSSMSVNK